MKNLTSVWILGASVAAGPVFATTNVQEAAQGVQTKTYEMLGKDTTTVSFESSSSDLSDWEKSNLRSVVEAAKRDQKVEKVIVAAWSDEDYPASDQKELSDSAKELADERAKAIETALEEYGADNVEVHSMAERPNWFADTFNLRSAQIKRGTAAEGAAQDEQANKIGETLRNKGGPGKAVVIVR